jgi:hypothetical protein
MAYTGIYRTAWVEITSNNGLADAAIPPFDTPVTGINHNKESFLPFSN